MNYWDEADALDAEATYWQKEIESMRRENEELRAKLMTVTEKGMAWAANNAELKSRAEREEAEAKKWHDAYMAGVTEWNLDRARAERAEAECLEQARLNGMGSEREAGLLGRIQQLEAALRKIIKFTPGYSEVCCCFEVNEVATLTLSEARDTNASECLPAPSAPAEHRCDDATCLTCIDKDPPREEKP